MRRLIERMIEFMTQTPTYGRFTGCFGDGVGGPCSPKCERCILLADLREALDRVGVEDKQTESVEEKGLKSFEALVNSEEHKRIMEKYYGELIQVKVSGHCNKCEPAPGKMVPVTPPLSDGTVRCMGCGRVMGEE